ncbi:glutamate-1-semialdehyde 2,1-aminomutase [Thermosulfuriphilus sp.]
MKKITKDLDPLDIKILALLQEDIPLVEQPFRLLAQRVGISEKQFLKRLQSLQDRGLIRRFGATIRHDRSGYPANAMVAWQVPEERLEEVGNLLAAIEGVTHCYARRAPDFWPYNLYTMVHGPDEEACLRLIAQMARRTGVSTYEILFTEREFKRSTRRYFKTTAEEETMENKLSQAFYQEAVQFIPGGVNSPVRACKSVGADPIFIARGAGAYIWDVDGHEYVDYVASWGPLILGHAHPEVISAINEAAAEGTSFGAPTWREVELARLICKFVPSIEMVRLVNSGTEATMSAVRLARGYTGRKKIIKFDGCYHGHADSFLVKAGSGVATLGIPGSPGVPKEIVANTISIPYNDLKTLRKVLDEQGQEIACVIVEPVAGNMGVVPPREDFLPRLREWTKEMGIVLIFDEVITGFRVALGGAQELYGIEPDLTCLGKIIGGGLPVGAYGGRREIMNHIAPEGPVYQAGTLSGNPLATAAGLATLKVLSRPGTYEALESRAQALSEGLSEILKGLELPVQMNRVGSMMTLFFTENEVVDFATAATSDTELYGRYWRAMLAEGIYLAPSQFEAAFVSLAHGEQEIEHSLEAAAKVLKELSTNK